MYVIEALEADAPPPSPHRRRLAFIVYGPYRQRIIALLASLWVALRYPDFDVTLHKLGT